MEQEKQYPVAINVTGIESKDGKITLLDHRSGDKYPTKYTFWMNKQDGTPSKAFTQFSELGVQIGKVYQAEVKEVTKPNPKSGKDATYRNVMFFHTGKVTTPTPNPKPTQDYVSRTEFENTTQAIRMAFKELRDKLDKHITNYPFID